MEIVDIADKGRGIIAAKIYEEGNLVAREKPYAHVMMSGHVEKTCHFCFVTPNQLNKGEKPLSKCTACKYARYCNRTCQKRAWIDHKAECKSIQKVSTDQLDDQVRLVARLLWKGKQNQKGNTKQSFEVEDLESHVEKRTKEEINVLHKKILVLGDYYATGQMLESYKEIVHLFAAIDCNAVGLYDHRGLQIVGVGLFSFASMLNHDCNPNCALVNCGPQLEIRAIRKIFPEEELCICYVGCLETTKVRRDKLLSQYYFECRCKLCESGSEKEVLKQAVINKNEEKETIMQITEFTKDMLKKIQEAKEVAEILLQLNFPILRQDWEKMSSIGLETLKKQDRLLGDTNLLKIAVLNHLVEVHSVINRLDSAVGFAERVANAYEKLLPPFHPSLGMYWMRLGTLQCQLQKNEAAVRTLGRAANIISKSYGETHPIFKEILRMWQRSQMEVSMRKNNE